MNIQPPPEIPKNEISLTQRLKNMRTYLRTRRPPTNFQLNFTLTSSTLGFCTGLLTLNRFLQEKRISKERRLDKQVNIALDKIINKFERTEVTKSLYKISKYKRKKLANYYFPYCLIYPKPSDRDWSSMWFNEMNSKNEQAIEVDDLRRNLKGFFYFLKHSYERNPKRKHEFQEILHDDPVNKDTVVKFLELVEPLDIMRCQKNENCIWERDAPHIYEWLRNIYKEDLNE
eukprot:gene9773-2099_t